MTLNDDDLQQIRRVVEEVVDSRLKPVVGELEALRNDIKEIYDMIAKLQNGNIPDASFQKLSLEDKLLKLNTELLSAAKQAGITLPR